MKFRKPGRRIIKTALAVFISLVISHLRTGQATEFYSAIAAIVCMQPDVSGTIHIGKNRILGTAIGGLAGFIYLVAVENLHLTVRTNYFFLSLIMAFLMWLMSNLDKRDAISIMSIVFLSIAINHSETSSSALSFAISRTTDTFVGVVVAIAVNRSEFKFQDRLDGKRQREE